MEAPLLHLIQIMKGAHSPADLAMIERAYSFAKEAHEGQKRFSGEEYLSHPLATAEILALLHLDPATIAAALLHDVPEDTDRTLEELQVIFGGEVASLVVGVTKLGKIRYRKNERRESRGDPGGQAEEIESLRRMFFAMGEDLRVILIKLADRLHNMRTIDALPEAKRERIARETLEIFAPIANRLGIGEMKGELEDLAFPIAFPEEYQKIQQLLTTSFSRRRQVAEQFRGILVSLLAEQGIKVLESGGRAKHLYSLYRKLESPQYNWDVSKITDLVALRIIVPDTQACYAALGAIHARYRPVPGKVKDYIAAPKPNGYRSLHTTIFEPEGELLEIQIKTPAMHAEAEYGIAAHWAYSEAGKPAGGVKSLPEHLGWVQQLARWQREIGKDIPDEEYLRSLKIDFFKNRIFVFTPKGEVKELPEGATCVDFAYAVHTEIGDRAMGAKVNGKLTPLSAPLSNGDIVEILTAKHHKGPSRDWLGFVKTSHAREVIRRYHRRQEQTVPKVEKSKIIRHTLRVDIQDRVGLLKDISGTCAALSVNIRSVKTRIPKRGLGTITLVVEPHGPEVVKTLTHHLATIRGVRKVTVER